MHDTSISIQAVRKLTAASSATPTNLETTFSSCPNACPTLKFKWTVDLKSPFLEVPILVQFLILFYLLAYKDTNS